MTFSLTITPKALALLVGVPLALVIAISSYATLHPKEHAFAAPFLFACDEQVRVGLLRSCALAPAAYVYLLFKGV